MEQFYNNVKTKIKTEGILSNVISDTGVAENSSIKLVIEGELPWKIN